MRKNILFLLSLLLLGVMLVGCQSKVEQSAPTPVIQTPPVIQDDPVGQAPSVAPDAPRVEIPTVALDAPVAQAVNGTSLKNEPALTTPIIIHSKYSVTNEERIKVAKKLERKETLQNEDAIVLIVEKYPNVIDIGDLPNNIKKELLKKGYYGFEVYPDVQTKKILSICVSKKDGTFYEVRKEGESLNMVPLGI